MTDSSEVKSFVMGLGADLCGIAPADRFGGAPEGFRPTDIYENCRSVLVFAKRVPTEPLFARNCVPYSFVNSFAVQVVDKLSFEIALALEDRGIRSVPIPSDDPYEHWEADRCYGRAILSMRHAGHLAGLGVMGKNTLLINEEFGNMIQIGAVLLDVELAGDDIATYAACAQDCSLCIDSCPVKALDGATVDQQLCRPLSTFRTEKGYVLKKCNICRRACPHSCGSRTGAGSTERQ